MAEGDAGLEALLSSYPKSEVVGCSTAGEIFEDELTTGGISAAVLRFDCTKIRVVTCSVDSVGDDFAIGESLAKTLSEGESLRGIFVLSDGLHVNGSELTRGINRSIEGSGVVVTGALAGDDNRFESTWVVVERRLKQKYVTAVGFYGDNVHVEFGSQGGWDRFGIDRRVTRAKGNVLYSLDNKPALELYKRYLGEYADELPASGLLFPLQVKKGEEEPKVRTIVAIDEKESSITFAGDIEEGSCASFMKANFDNLVSGAEQAAMQIESGSDDVQNALLIAVSCVGRRLVLGQRSEDELEVVRDIFPPSVKMVGFYSYGEISTRTNGRCDLLNQTMTLTRIWEGCAG